MSAKRVSPEIRQRLLEVTVVEEIETVGRAAELFGVPKDLAYSWVGIARREGRFKAKSCGGDVKSHHIDKFAEHLLEWQKSQVTLREMSNKLKELGCKHSSKDAIKGFFRRRNIQLKRGRPFNEKVKRPHRKAEQRRRISLSLADRKRLIQISVDGKMRARFVLRAKAMLFLDKGWKVSRVSTSLGITRSSIYYWLNRMQQGGIDDLMTFNYRGAKCKLSEGQVKKLLEWVDDELPGSLRIICKWVWKEFNVIYSRSGMSKFLDRHGFAFRMPKKYPKLPPLEDQIAFIKKYEELKSSLGPYDSIEHIDGVHPVNNVKPRGFWGRKKVKYGVKCSTGRERKNIHGALNLLRKTFTFTDEETIDKHSVIRLFEKILETNQDNVARGGKIHVISDNAKYYKAKLISDWLEERGLQDTIVRHFLPPYSPHLNPIEFVWRVLHENVTHNCWHANFGEFSNAVLHFLEVEFPKQLKSGEVANIVNDDLRPISTEGVTMVNRVAA